MHVEVIELARIIGYKTGQCPTYNRATTRKQEHSLQKGLDKLRSAITTKWASYKKPPKDLPRGIRKIQEDNDYGTCLEVTLENGQPHFKEITDEIEQQRRRVGKNLMFSNKTAADTGYLIDTYKSRNTIDGDFRVLKDETLIRFRPIRHWTDTKISTHAFCCVVGFTLMRVMQWRPSTTGYKMSSKLLQDELSDIKEVIMVYNSTNAKRKITERSAVQEKLWTAFRLEEIEMQLLLH